MSSASLRSLAVIAVILATLAWILYARTLQPQPESVNGSYSNRCCNDVILRDGMVLIGKSRVPFALQNMKFGLTAYTAARLEVRGGAILAIARESEESPSLAFSRDRKTLTVCGDKLCNKTYAFVRR